MEPSNQDMPKLINFLKNDGYQFERVNYNPQFGGSARAIFEKMTHIDENNGNDVNDATITVTVDFDTRFDYKNIVRDEEDGDYIYDKTKAHEFIEKLMDGNYGGGKRKGRKSSRKTRKTRKNRRI